MDVETDASVQRRRRRIAASYRKQGYRVNASPAAGSLPTFLSDCQPDIIAERDDDHVVIEVRPARSLKGAADLVVLAERVATQPGWRLELVALRTEERPTLTAGWLDRMLGSSGADLADRAYLSYAADVLGVLIRDVALRNRIKVRDRTTRQVAGELAFAGVIGEELLDRITQVVEAQDSLLHERPVPVDAADVEKLCRDLYAQAQATGD
jgi:hypothetical protein